MHNIEKGQVSQPVLKIQNVPDARRWWIRFKSDEGTLYQEKPTIVSLPYISWSINFLFKSESDQGHFIMQWNAIKNFVAAHLDLLHPDCFSLLIYLSDDHLKHAWYVKATCLVMKTTDTRAK